MTRTTTTGTHPITMVQYVDNTVKPKKNKKLLCSNDVKKSVAISKVKFLNLWTL